MAKTKQTKKKTRADYIELIPFLKPGTYSALKVLRKLQQIVRQEPRRMDMGEWMTMYAGKALGFNAPLWDDRPQCGTVACAAGWINTITGHYRANLTGAAGERAVCNLGLGKKMVRRGLYGNFVDVAYKTDEANAASDALQELFGRIELEPLEVVEELDRLIKEHRKALSEAKITIEE